MVRDYSRLGVLAMVLLFGGIAALPWTDGPWRIAAVVAIAAGVCLFAVVAWLQLRRRVRP